jgi:uncharacterized membrane protein YcaP (DUF421 family)
LSDNDVNEALRKAGMADPSKVEQMTLEPSGAITILKSES